MAQTIRDAWPAFVFAACCLFLADVAVRRITIDFGIVVAYLAKLRGKRDENTEQVQSRLQSLKAQKDRVGDTLERQRAASRFQPDPDIQPSADAKALADQESSVPADSGRKNRRDSSLAPQQEEKSYTERLLEAKRRAAKKNNEES